jgi:transcription initiation factor TFIID subunit 7
MRIDIWSYTDTSGFQMLVVQDRIENEQTLNSSKTFNVDEFIWPHGITPPLHYARKRRFRKRANKRVSGYMMTDVYRSS